MIHRARPVKIDSAYFADVRNAHRRHLRGASELSYLLPDEMVVLLNGFDQETQQALFGTLWCTGAKISEVLALTPSAVRLHLKKPVIRLPAVVRQGTVLRTNTSFREIPVSDPWYQDVMARLLDAHPGHRQSPLWSVSRQSASRWLNSRLSSMPAQSVSWLNMPISLMTFRHSFAVNALLHHVPVEVVQRWLGLKRRDSMWNYLQLFTADDHALIERVPFR